jgi:glutaredoxin
MPSVPPPLASRRAAAPSPLLALAAALLVIAAPAGAQYKVVGADGKVTYSDREPSGGDGRVTALGARGATPTAEPELPFELRQVAAKYPVTLYTAPGACEPCAAARELLKLRGIPFSERQVVSDEDSAALERVAGARDLPTLMIGTQAVRGLTSQVWSSYLDAAGYPRESRLPPSYQYRAATPVVGRREPAAAPVAANPVPSAPATPAPSGPANIRF